MRGQCSTNVATMLNSTSLRYEIAALEVEQASLVGGQEFES